MNRFGRPQFRGAAAPKPYARPTSQGNNFGSSSMRQVGDRQQDSYQNKSEAWQPSQSGSLLGEPPKRFGGNDSSRTSGGNQSFQQNNPPVPTEVRKLMHNLGLSQGDIQKLSQLPEKELSASNLARAIGDLRQGKDNDRRSQSFDSSTSGPNRSGSFRREERGSFGGDGILGERPEQPIRYPPSRPDERRFDKHSEQDSPFFDSDNRRKNSDRFSEQQYDRNEYMDSKPGPRFGDRRQFSRSDRDDDYYDDSPSYRRGGSDDRYDQPNDDSFSQNNRRFNNKNINQREEESRQGYGGERRMERGRQDAQGGRGPRGTLPRPGGMRNSARSIPPLMRESPRREEGRMGNPNRSGAQGLGDLVAAVGGGSVGQAASLLTPLMLATQTDPSVLEAQIQAMKALQAQAIKMKEQDSYNRPGRDQRRGRTPPRRRSPPPLRSRGGVIDRRLEEEARKEAQIMRSARGRVLYIKFKSPRIVEDDLRQMASVFGKVTKLLLIKPKIPNGHFQVFMEMDQWDCAAAMLEHYMAKAPNIKGCPVDVKRSNYVDLKLRHEQNRGNKRLRSRSISPIREGTTQLSHKRDRMDGTPKLSITTSKSDRRVVTRSNSAENKEETAITGDAREILNRTRSDQENKDGEKKVRGRTRWDSASSANKSTDKDGDNNEKGIGEDGEMDQDADGSIKEKTDLSEADAPKEESSTAYDPLDAIADELALHDEFVLMEEADKKGEKKNETVGDKSEDADEEEKKEPADDLEKNDFDLNDVNVDDHPTEEEDFVKEQVDDDHQAMEVLNEKETNKESYENQSKVNFEEVAASVYIVKEESSDEDENEKQQASSPGDQPQNDRYLTAEELSDLQDKELNKSVEKNDGFVDSTTQKESEPANVSTGLIDAIDELLENSDDDRPYLEEDQLETEESFRMDKIEHLQTLMEDSLKEVQSARNHLEALTKVTKAKAALALAKKIDVCLEIASGFLRNPESPSEE